MTLAVTGATGHFGRHVVEQLLAHGTAPDQIVALVRRPEALADLAARGIQVRHFDYNSPEVVALAGVDSLLLVSGTEFGRRATQHSAVIDAAVAAGVGRLAYTSAPGADASINPVAPEHKATEEHLRASGLSHLILRNGWYHENYVGDLKSAAQTGIVLTAAGQGRVASAARSDLAEAAAILLAGERVGQTYTLTGDVAWSFDDLAADFATILGREVVAHHVTVDEKRSLLAQAGLDDGTIGFILGVDAAIAAGELGVVNGELAEILGRPTTPLAETLRPLIQP